MYSISHGVFVVHVCDGDAARGRGGRGSVDRRGGVGVGVGDADVASVMGFFAIHMLRHLRIF